MLSYICGIGQGEEYTVMTYQVQVDDAKARLRDLIEAAIRGEHVYILEDDQPVVQLVPVGPRKRQAKFGSAKGLITVADDFDAPLADTTLSSPRPL
jgi:antitoxin (DNA-binding transcriptional repressor) of toxin-antitoxin stability system